VVGLKFDIPLITPQPQTMHQNNVATPLAGSSSEDSAHQLHVLHQIHKTGGLTDAKYSYETAKAKILTKM